MAETTITVPDFKFTGMYYPQILRMLRQYRRVNVPEITSEDAHEPFEQCLRAFALSSHISNVLADLVALESLLPTAKLLSAVRDHLKLIDYILSLATPAQADAVLELTKVFTTTTVLIPYGAQFATERTEVTDEITFEYLVNVNGFSIDPTDVLGSCMIEERTTPTDPATATFTDKTTEANSVSGSTFSPWATPGNNDAIYFGHPNVMFNRVDIALAAGGEASGIQGVWEFYDGDTADDNPDDVTNNGSNLTFKINDYLGAQNRQGAKITVTYLPTGASEEVYSTFDGTYNKITTTGLLNQTTTPSTKPEDYSVGCEWNPLKNVVDETNDFQNSGKVTFSLPQTSVLKWTEGTVNDAVQFWVRYRITTTTAPPASKPEIEHVKIDQGKQYVIVQLTQGESVTDIPLGSSNGLANQTFELKQSPLIESSLVVSVSDTPWIQVADFLSSGPQDKHFSVTVGDDDVATIKFGNGTNGAIPTLGVNNITAAYRIGGSIDGNIAPDSLTENKGGLAFVAALTNPRAGNGWKVKDGGTDEDMARIKVAGPASLRTQNRAVAVGDVEVIAPDYKNAAGSKPISRAFEIEEAYGPKTVEIVCVGSGGNYLTAGQVTEFQEYLNGKPLDVPPVRGVIHTNTEATVVNYERRVIDVTATVYGGNKTQIENAISALLSPLKLKSDGLTFQWNFGGEVPLSMIIDAIHNVSLLIRKVTLTNPSADTVLGTRQLPYPGTLSITVNP